MFANVSIRNIINSAFEMTQSSHQFLNLIIDIILRRQLKVKTEKNHILCCRSQHKPRGYKKAYIFTTVIYGASST